MLDILTTDQAVPEPVAEVRAAETTETEYEFVLGRTQVASVLFVATVALVTFSSFAYLVGKAQTPEQPALIAVARPAPPSAPASIAPAEPAKAKTVEPVKAIAPVKIAAPTTLPEPPLFQDPTPNATYLQMGAVERGIAVVFAEGLRQRGLQSFVAPGPNDKIFRVLIGPLADPQAYRIVKDKVDAIGLNTFAKKYVTESHINELAPLRLP